MPALEKREGDHAHRLLGVVGAVRERHHVPDARWPSRKERLATPGVFQTIAPISAASTVFSFARPVSMIPLPTVFATAVVTNAPARFATAAMSTARRGERARVETEVATAFAVSWNPFVKSKPSATITTMTSRTLSKRYLFLTT